jgi:LPS sulfotransferase NodH
MRKFLIVGTQRTGSSALAEAVGLHPQIACGWEWTSRTTPWNKLKVAERALGGDFTDLRQKARAHIEAELTDSKTVLGFRRLFRSSSKWLLHPRHSPALWSDRLEGHLRWLAQRPEIHIVHVVRRNNLAWLRSKVLAGASGRYVGSAYPQHLQISVPIRMAVRSVQAKTWVDRRLATLRSSNPYIRIAYEDFAADHLTPTRHAVSFLGCDPSALPPLQLRIKSQSRSRGDSQICNADKLQETLRKLGMLDAGALCDGVTHSQAGD